MTRISSSFKKSEASPDVFHHTYTQGQTRLSRVIHVLALIDERELPKNKPFSYTLWTDARIPKLFADKAFTGTKGDLCNTIFLRKTWS